MPEPWKPSPASDTGLADPHVRRALAAAYQADEGYARAVAALCTARLILPTVEAPQRAEPGRSHGKDEEMTHRALQPPAGRADHPEMAAVLLRNAHGDRAVVVFTGMDSLAAWRADAHPVRCALDDVAATCAETGASSILVDVAGPHPLVIEQGLVSELARGRRLVELPDGGFGWMFLSRDAAEASA